jgi:hypothetical protein
MGPIQTTDVAVVDVQGHNCVEDAKRTGRESTCQGGLKTEIFSRLRYCQSVLVGPIQTTTDVDVVDVVVYNRVEDDAKQTKGFDKLS